MRPANNAARMNQLQIQEQQQLNRERKRQNDVEEQRRLATERKIRSQYDYVGSNGYGRPGAAQAGLPHSAPTASSAGDDVEIRVYVRECEGNLAERFSYRESSPQSLGRGPAQPAPAAARGPARSSVSQAAPAGPDPAAPNKGKVPRYLQQRKAEMAAERRAQEEEEARQKELAKIPPGHRLVSEQEKADTLVKMEERRRELETELGKIPVRFDTQSIKNKRRAIEEELQQIDTAKLKYSTKKPLYVPIA